MENPTISMSEIDLYFEKQYKKDLTTHYVFIPMMGYKYADSVRHRLYPRAGERLENRPLFAAFVFFFVIAQNVLKMDGDEDLLIDFLRVSKMPKFVPSNRMSDPGDFLDRSELPSPDTFVPLMPGVSEYIYKELELTLKCGNWRSKVYGSHDRSEAESRLLSLPESKIREILGRYQEDSYMFLQSYESIRSKRPYPPFSTKAGSVLRGDRYGLDGIVVFQRRGFNGLNSATTKLVSGLMLLKDLGTIKVYRHFRHPLDTVIVYNYANDHTADQALKAFSDVLNVAKAYHVKRLGMNGLELTGDVKAGCGEGQAMMNLVKDALGNFESIPFSEICFIDPRGAFNK